MEIRVKLLLTTIAILFSQMAFACKCENYNIENQFGNADEVLYIFVRATEFFDSKKEHGERVKVTYDIVESFKRLEGSPNYVLQDLTSCSPNLQAGRHYVLFTKANRYTSHCSGTGQLPSWDKERLDEAFKQLRKLAI